MNLEQAIRLAAEAHEGQVDKAGQPYILHCLRVMMAMETDEERIVAVLHDVVEDSNFTGETLRAAGVHQELLEEIITLTKFPLTQYDYYITQIAASPIARKVKIADLNDNMNLDRLPMVTDEDNQRWAKYHKALMLLMNKEWQSWQDPAVS